MIVYNLNHDMRFTDTAIAAFVDAVVVTLIICACMKTV